MLEIRKKGVKHFRHYDEANDYEPYSANDIKIIFDGNIVKLRSVNGRVIFEKDGYLYSDIRIYDDSDSGLEESFPNIQSLIQRLIILGYPFLGSDNTIIIDGTTWGLISGDINNQPDLIALFDTKIETVTGSENIDVDDSDPNNVIVSLTGIIDGGTIT